MKQLFVMLIAVLGLSLVALAAEDATGTWKVSVETPGGTQVNTIVLKMEGGKVIGTMGSEAMGTVQIADGKMDGENISFSINTADYGAVAFSGKVKGDKMPLTLRVGDYAQDIEATRAK